MWANILLIAGAYFYGAIPFVLFIARFKGVDLRHHGSQNIGGGNLTSAVGFWPGFTGSVCDFSKGVVPVLIGHYILGTDTDILCITGLAAISGQMWPVWTGFYGGRGISVSAAVLITLVGLSVVVWVALLAFAPLFASVVIRNLKATKGEKSPTRMVPLCTLLVFALVPTLTWFSSEPQVITFTFLILFLLLIIRRLTADISNDLKYRAQENRVRNILVNRLLYDRSYQTKYH